MSNDIAIGNSSAGMTSTSISRMPECVEFYVANGSPNKIYVVVGNRQTRDCSTNDSYLTVAVGNYIKVRGNVARILTDEKAELFCGLISEYKNRALIVDAEGKILKSVVLDQNNNTESDKWISSADGKYHYPHDFYVANASGSDLRVLTSNDQLTGSHATDEESEVLMSGHYKLFNGRFVHIFCNEPNQFIFSDEVQPRSSIVVVRVEKGAVKISNQITGQNVEKLVWTVDGVCYKPKSLQWGSLTIPLTSWFKGLPGSGATGHTLRQDKIQNSEVLDQSNAPVGDKPISVDGENNCPDDFFVANASDYDLRVLPSDLQLTEDHTADEMSKMLKQGHYDSFRGRFVHIFCTEPKQSIFCNEVQARSSVIVIKTEKGAVKISDTITGQNVDKSVWIADGKCYKPKSFRWRMFNYIPRFRC